MDEKTPPAEDVIRKLATLLNDNFDELMQLAGRVPEDVEKLIKADPDMPVMLRRAREQNVTGAPAALFDDFDGFGAEVHVVDSKVIVEPLCFGLDQLRRDEALLFDLVHNLIHLLILAFEFGSDIAGT